MLGDNIKLLREEARLSRAELAEKVGISEQVLTDIEKGLARPSDRLLEKMCVYLRISLEDIKTRDIVSERQEALKNMKKDKTRGDYNWYLGSKTKMAFYISYLIIIPATFLLTLFCFLLPQKEVMMELFEWTEQQAMLGCFTYAYLFCAFPTLVYLIIFVFKNIKIRLQWWMIFLVQFIIGLAGAAAVIAVIPGIVYSLYQVIVKRGKN